MPTNMNTYLLPSTHVDSEVVYTMKLQRWYCNTMEYLCRAYRFMSFISLPSCINYTMVAKNYCPGIDINKRPEQNKFRHDSFVDHCRT